MEDLGVPFKWAIKHSKGQKKALWQFYYGVWLAGRGYIDSAITVLKADQMGIGKVMLSRLLKVKGNNREALQALESIDEPWLQLHPQVLIDRDKLLRSLGPQMIATREQWLSKVDALKDEWLIERKVQLLIDKEEYQMAKDLLLSTPFQKVHQTYTRTGLWQQISDKLNLPFHPIPASLGEDELAHFGAYREYE